MLRPDEEATQLAAGHLAVPSPAERPAASSLLLLSQGKHHKSWQDLGTAHPKPQHLGRAGRPARWAPVEPEPHPLPGAEGSIWSHQHPESPSLGTRSPTDKPTHLPMLLWASLYNSQKPSESGRARRERAEEPAGLAPPRTPCQQNRGSSREGVDSQLRVTRLPGTSGAGEAPCALDSAQECACPDCTQLLRPQQLQPQEFEAKKHKRRAHSLQLCWCLIPPKEPLL